MTRKETKLKAGSLERSIKLINPYLTDGGKKEISQPYVTHVRNERGIIMLDSIDIKSIICIYVKQLYVIEFVMVKFL